MNLKLISGVVLCLILQSCVDDNHHTSDIYSETMSVVYQNRNRFDVVGLNSAYVCERNGEHNERSYSVMLDLLLGYGMMTHVKLDETDLAPLRCFLDSCKRNSGKLIWEESFEFKKNGETLFETSSDKIEDHLFCQFSKNCLVDMIVSFEKFDAILEKAEMLIEKKKKNEKDVL